MRQACDNLEKYETMTPVKENRKFVSKRKANETNSEESDNEASEIVQPVDSKASIYFLVYKNICIYMINL